MTESKMPHQLQQQIARALLARGISGEVAFTAPNAFAILLEEETDLEITKEMMAVHFPGTFEEASALVAYYTL